MAYIYKTVLRRENYDFDICQNRSNSKEIIILAVKRDAGYEIKHLGIIQNKTGKVIIMDTCGFKEKTIDDLRKKLSVA